MAGFSMPADSATAGPAAARQLAALARKPAGTEPGRQDYETRHLDFSSRECKYLHDYIKLYRREEGDIVKYLVKHAILCVFIVAPIAAFVCVLLHAFR